MEEELSVGGSRGQGVNQEGGKKNCPGKNSMVTSSTKSLHEVSVHTLKARSVIRTVCFSPGSAGTE